MLLNMSHVEIIVDGRQVRVQYFKLTKGVFKLDCRDHDMHDYL